MKAVLNTPSNDEPRPSLLKLGGYDNFADYKWVFDSLYKERPVHDVYGHRVVFGSQQLNGPYDATHACFGGVDVDWRNPPREKWDQTRAERLLWIGQAVSNPKVLVYPDDLPKRLRYLLTVDADPPRRKSQEYYMVILQVVDANTKAFVTAYDITRAAWENYKKKGPRYYPPPPAKTGEPPKKKKGKA